MKVKYIITCNEDWTEHGDVVRGDDSDAVLPNEADTLADAERMGAKHAAQLGGLHRSFRIWRFDRDFVPKESVMPYANETGKEKVYERVDHPTHYGGKDNPYEAIKVIEAWELGFCLGNTVKYIARAGRKPDAAVLDDLKKARWYLDREIARLEGRA